MEQYSKISSVKGREEVTVANIYLIEMQNYGGLLEWRTMLRKGVTQIESSRKN